MPNALSVLNTAAAAVLAFGGLLAANGLALAALPLAVPVIALALAVSALMQTPEEERPAAAVPDPAQRLQRGPKHP